MPVLDDPILATEVEAAIKQLHGNKSASIDGISPGILKLLPASCVVLVTTLFNFVFNGNYIPSWLTARFVTLYKKGPKDNTDNYRGISIMCAFAKLYDMVLLSRFLQWYSPSPEQAGAVKGKGCLEQILCLRLLADIARKSHQTL